MKDVMGKTKTRIEASTQRTTGGTTFHVKGDTENTVDAAIRSITAALSPHVGFRLLYSNDSPELSYLNQVTLTINAPISTIGTIIGPKGIPHIKFYKHIIIN